MSLSQGQIIRSLAEALSWFEKELVWKVAPGELRHLTGRIGELYAAMISRGQMALATNQRGYDVVSDLGEHISVKTITSSNHTKLNKKTLSEVDRVMVLRISIDEGEVSIQEVYDGKKEDFLKLCSETAFDYVYTISTSTRIVRPLTDLKIVAQVKWEGSTVSQYENGTIIVTGKGEGQPTRPVLREIAEATATARIRDSLAPPSSRRSNSPTRLGSHLQDVSCAEGYSFFEHALQVSASPIEHGARWQSRRRQPAPSSSPSSIGSPATSPSSPG